MERTTIAAELAAELELGLKDSARRAAERLLNLNDIVSQLREIGFSRKVTDRDTVTAPQKIVAVSTASSTMPALGGVLYGVSALAQGMEIVGADILDSWHATRVTTGDIDLLNQDERIYWHTLRLAYELLEQVMTEKQVALILLDFPLFISRREQTTVFDSELAEDEWQLLEQTINQFWKKYLPKLFPFDPFGPMIVSIRSHSATSIFAALRENPATSSDAEGQIVGKFIQQNWDDIRKLGQSRILERVIRHSSRTLAYSFEDLDADPRWHPAQLHQVGIIGLFMRAHKNTAIWHLQIPGHRTQWQSEQLDQLVGQLIAATLYDQARALPLPLWFAKQYVHFPPEILIAYSQAIQEELKKHD